MATNHAMTLGMLVGNLHSLEAMMRLSLLSTEAGRSQVPYWDLRVGDVVPVDAFTNYDSLSRIVSKYNSWVSQYDPTLQVDPAVIEIRDLIAHGRVAASSRDEATLTIMKFDRPSGNSVSVTAFALMSNEWFKSHNTLVRVQIEHVQKALAQHAA